MGQLEAGTNTNPHFGVHPRPCCWFAATTPHGGYGLGLPSEPRASPVTARMEAYASWVPIWNHWGIEAITRTCKEGPMVGGEKGRIEGALVIKTFHSQDRSYMSSLCEETT